jgi:putative acetyltransferase
MNGQVPRDAGCVSDVTIRPECADADDHLAIAEVVGSAFGSASIVELVADIRRSEHFVPELSLVAEREGTVVGHVMISHAEVHDGGRRERIAMLSPLAVAPAEQRRGIGSLLVGAVTARAAELGARVVVLEGSPHYYGRLGFGPAADLGLTLPLPSWAPVEAAQVIRLAAKGPYPRGTVVYPPAFDAIAEG